MSEASVAIDQPAPHVVRLLINRPDKRNAIDYSVRQGLIEALSGLSAQRDARALILGGVGGVFSAGGDLPTMCGLNEAQARERMRQVHRICRLVAGLPIPVISAIEGVGAGGAIGLALLGDHIVVGERTTILFPFLRLGLTPDWGQLLTLPLRVGQPAARRILLSGAAVSGPEATKLGLADTLVPDERVMGAAVKQAEAFTRLPSEAFARTKARLNPSSAELDDALRQEEADQAVCLLSSEFAEGFAAFQDKRAPDFVRFSRTG